MGTVGLVIDEVYARSGLVVVHGVLCPISAIAAGPSALALPGFATDVAGVLVSRALIVLLAYLAAAYGVLGLLLGQARRAPTADPRVLAVVASFELGAHAIPQRAVEQGGLAAVARAIAHNRRPGYSVAGTRGAASWPRVIVA